MSELLSPDELKERIAYYFEDHDEASMYDMIQEQKIAHADKVVGKNLGGSIIGEFNEKDAKAHALVNETIAFVNIHLDKQRKRNKV